MNHIVDMCPLTKFEGGLNLLHEADDYAVIWLESTVTAALEKLTITDRDKSVAGGKSAIMMCGAALDDLGNEDSVVTLHVLVANAACNAESQPCTIPLQRYFFHNRLTELWFYVPLNTK